MTTAQLIDLAWAVIEPNSVNTDPHETPEQRCARLDRARTARDHTMRRGYDFDCAAPSHAEYLERIGQTDCVCQRRDKGS
jgi:hypothetical protein